jgi:GNAT superfamily N-acetyltransferase
LEWWTLQEWIGSPTLSLAIDDRERIVGLMLAVIGDGSVAWLRAVATTADTCLLPLLKATSQAVLDAGSTDLAFLGDDRWILSRLKPVGFEKVNHVITLRQRGRWSVHHGPPGLQLRQATVADIDDVTRLDHAAFPPLWWYSAKVLRRALDASYCFHVAYLKKECVGYQFSTLRHRHAHIVRLATHPRWSQRGIGARLLSEALLVFDQARANSVTLNTQQDNLASLRLYRRFNFKKVGRPWPVWRKRFAPQMPG